MDDRPEQLYSRDSILRYHGFTVANSDSWQAALVVARQLRPDLIVLTVRLRELLDQVRADAKLAHIPVVVIADGDEGAADEVAALQGRRVDAFLAGPVAPEALAASLKRLLGTT